MNLIGSIVGEICKVVLPIPEEVYYGNQKSQISICTLSSIKLLKTIASSDLMNEIAVVGRLLSENQGIDSLVRFIVSNNHVTTLLLCGKEVSGHLAGQALLALYKNGIDDRGRIIGSLSPEPILTAGHKQVKKFQNKIKIINKVGETEFIEIKKIINSIKN